MCSLTFKNFNDANEALVGGFLPAVSGLCVSRGLAIGLVYGIYLGGLASLSVCS